MRYSYILLLVFLLGCTPKPQSAIEQKESDLKGYFTTVFKNKIPLKNERVIILNNQSCSACRKEIIMSLVKKLKGSPIHRTYILMKEDTTLMSAISGDKDAKIFIDKTDKAGGYGLNYASDFIYLFFDNNLKNIFEVSASSVDKLVVHN